MIIKEYTDQAITARKAEAVESILGEASTWAVDAFIVAGYILATFSLMPIVVVYLWLSDNLTVQISDSNKT